MNDFILLQDNQNKNWQDLLIFNKRLSKKEFEKINTIVAYVKNYNGYCIDDITQELKKEFDFKWIELTDGRIKKIKY